jgi:hypothetical protein
VENAFAAAAKAGFPPVKPRGQFLTDEMTSHRVPHAQTPFHLAEPQIAVKNTASNFSVTGEKNC